MTSTVRATLQRAATTTPTTATTDDARRPIAVGAAARAAAAALAEERRLEEQSEERVVIAIDGQRWSLDVNHVREVLRWREPTPVPGAPPELRGLLNVRGAIVTVIDGGAVVPGAGTGDAPVPETPVRAAARGSIVLLPYGSGLLGLAVDAVLGVVGERALAEAAESTTDAAPALDPFVRLETLMLSVEERAR